MSRTATVPEKTDDAVFARLDPSGIYRRHLDNYPGLFLTTSQAAELLQLSRQEVAYMCRSGAIPNMPLRHSDTAHWRIPKLSLLMYLAGIDRLPGPGDEE